MSPSDVGTQQIPDWLRSTIETRLRERHTQGLALCAFDADGVRMAGGVGWADLERAEPVSPTTVFRAASISKLLTATLVLRLVDEGRLDLDEPVNRYLPTELAILDRDDAPAVIPLRSLLSHSSGLPAGVRGAVPANAAVSYVANGRRMSELADAIRGLRTVRHHGERVVYSNPAFNVAGFAAATALGMPFETATRERVLRPLGMADADFTPQRSGPGVATPYGSMVPPGVGPRSAASLRLVATPMGGLTTSASELARFGRMVLGGGAIDGQQVLDPGTLAAATSLEVTNHPHLEQGYGLGFRVRPWRGRTVVGHDGNMPGVSTQLLLSPEDGIGVAVLTNGYALAVPHEIAALALGHLVGASPEPATPADDAVVRVRDERVALGRRIAGTYRQLDASPPGVVGWANEAGVRIRLTHEVDGRLRLDGNPGSDGPAWLVPLDEPGRYRVVAPVDDGVNAVVDEQPDGVHLWLGPTTHLHRAAGRRSRGRR